MEIIRKDEGVNGENSKSCKTIEYSFKNKDMDLGIATITGRYPKKENEYCVNTECTELIYVLEGNGKLQFGNEEVDFFMGDTILISPNEKYAWITDYCKVSMVCTPAWNNDQHKIVN